MKCPSLLLLTAVAVLAGTQLALADGETIATYGIGQVAVTPTNPKSEASIRAALTAAEAKSWPLAVANARSSAQAIADATGLTLGAVMSVEQPANPYLFGGFSGAVVQSPSLRGPFNGRFCGRVTRAIFGRVNGKRRVVRRVRERRCFVPGAVANTLEVTFRATPKVSA